MTTTSHMSLAEGYVLTFGCTWVPGCTFQDFQNDYTVTLSYNVDTGSYALLDTTTAVYSFIAPDQSTWYVTAMSTYQHSGTWSQITSGTPQLQITTPALQPDSGTVGLAYDSQPLSATGGTPFPSISYSYPYTWTATNLPPGLYISYFTGAVYGTPAIDGSFTPTLIVKDFNGVTSSRTLSLTINAAPPTTKHRYTPAEKKAYAELVELYDQEAADWGQKATECSNSLPNQPNKALLCAVFRAFQVLALTNSGYYKTKLILDPPDPDYTVIAQPVPPPIDLSPIGFPAPAPTFTPTELALFNLWKEVASTQAQLIGLSRASATCVPTRACARSI
jgi:hypothetical protein